MFDKFIALVEAMIDRAPCYQMGHCGHHPAHTEWVELCTKS